MKTWRKCPHCECLIMQGLPLQIETGIDHTCPGHPPVWHALGEGFPEWLKVVKAEDA